MTAEAETRDDGGPAFPIPEQQFSDGVMVIGTQGYPGMSLRDWFATHATEQDIERHRVLRRNIAGYPLEEPVAREVARYRYADAMLRARASRTEG